MGEQQGCSMETLCATPRLAVPASLRGSPCPPTPQKPSLWTPEFSPLYLHAITLCTISKPRLCALGLGHGELVTRTDPSAAGRPWPRPAPAAGP
ncbi:hypothetical protein ACRRTK_021054 [Alexandromys fortis]